MENSTVHGKPGLGFYVLFICGLVASLTAHSADILLISKCTNIFLAKIVTLFLPLQIFMVQKENSLPSHHSFFLEWGLFLSKLIFFHRIGFSLIAVCWSDVWRCLVVLQVAAGVFKAIFGINCLLSCTELHISACFNFLWGWNCCRNGWQLTCVFVLAWAWGRIQHEGVMSGAF